MGIDLGIDAIGRARGLRCERRRRDAAGLWAVRRAAVPATDAPKNKFAGLFRDEESGLDHARARMYESRTGRFARLHGRNIGKVAMPGLAHVGFRTLFRRLFLGLAAGSLFYWLWTRYVGLPDAARLQVAMLLGVGAVAAGAWWMRLMSSAKMKAH